METAIVDAGHHHIRWAPYQSLCLDAMGRGRFALFYFIEWMNLFLHVQVLAANVM